MDLSKIAVGANPPYDLNAVIEIPQGGEPVKYEIDKASGALMVDRFLHTAMFYPANYGFIPHTLADDGDPADIMVVGPTPVVPGAIIRCRPIGALMMVDEAGSDEKILAVPVDKLHPFYTGVNSWRDLPVILTEQIAHFFQHYKDLEKGKSTKITGWADLEETADIIRAAIKRHDDNYYVELTCVVGHQAGHEQDDHHGVDQHGHTREALDEPAALGDQRSHVEDLADHGDAGKSSDKA